MALIETVHPWLLFAIVYIALFGVMIGYYSGVADAKSEAYLNKKYGRFWSLDQEIGFWSLDQEIDMELLRAKIRALGISESFLFEHPHEC